jgi:nitrile hydratase
MGGMQGMGAIDIEPNEPSFHDDWEQRMFGLFLSMFAGGHYNIDEFRHGIERMGGPNYMATTYYEHWVSGMQTMLIEKGILTAEEINGRMSELAGGNS